MKNVKACIYLYFVLLSAGTFVIDRLTKQWVVHTLPVGEPKPVMGHFLYFTQVHNTGGAFGLFSNFSLLFVIMGVLVPVLILIFFKKLIDKGPAWIVGTAFILGGAIGNLIDRVLYGYVIDFIDVRFWPIFNVADISITVGIGILFIVIMREGKEKEKQ